MSAIGRHRVGSAAGGTDFCYCIKSRWQEQLCCCEVVGVRETLITCPYARFTEVETAQALAQANITVQALRGGRKMDILPSLVALSVLWWFCRLPLSSQSVHKNSSAIEVAAEDPTSGRLSNPRVAMCSDQAHDTFENADPSNFSQRALGAYTVRVDDVERYSLEHHHEMLHCSPLLNAVNARDLRRGNDMQVVTWEDKRSVGSIMIQGRLESAASLHLRSRSVEPSAYGGTGGMQVPA